LENTQFIELLLNLFKEFLSRSLSINFFLTLTLLVDWNFIKFFYNIHSIYLQLSSSQNTFLCFIRHLDNTQTLRTFNFSLLILITLIHFLQFSLLWFIFIFSSFLSSFCSYVFFKYILSLVFDKMFGDYSEYRAPLIFVHRISFSLFYNQLI